MDKSTKRNRNYEKTEVAIKDALVQLCSEKSSLYQVTVKELCEKANISKSTFYLHYADIQSIFEAIGDKFLLTFNDLLNELLRDKTLDFSIYIQRVFAFINESSDLIKIGISFGMPFNYYINGIKERLEKVVIKSPLFSNTIIDKKQLLVEAQIVTSGIMDCIIELIKRKELDKLNEYGPLINNFLNRWVSSFKNSI